MTAAKSAPNYASFPVDELEGSIEQACASDPTLAAAAADALAVRELVDELIRLRKVAGLTQTDVARLMQVRQPTVSQFETEASDPRISTVQRYARAVGSRMTMHVLTSRGVFSSDHNAYAPTAGTVRQLTRAAKSGRTQLASDWAVQIQSKSIRAA